MRVVVNCLRTSCRGFGLATVLLVGLFLAVLLTVLVGANLSTLSVVRHSEGTVIARGAAESALARAIYEIKSNPAFGKNGESITFRPQPADRELADIQFDPASAEEAGVPASINNLDNAESVPDGMGGVVPARTVRLFSVGRYGDDHRTVMLDLHIPPYPYAVATEGTFESLGDLSLTGLSPDTGEKVPGDIATNGTGSTSLKLGPRTEISGDAISEGGIDVSSDSVTIDGEVKPYSKHSDIPRIQLTDFDPRKMTAGGDTTNLTSSFYRDPNLQGKVLRDGDLMMSGQIKLDGALLYVEGNVELSGTIFGRGAIVATGSISISGTQSLTTDNELAILCGQDLSILGNGVDSSKIEGLIYSEGNVEVRNSTIQGTLISQSNGGTTPRVVMEKTNMLYDPNATQFSTTLHQQSNVVNQISYLTFSGDGRLQPQTQAPTPTTPSQPNSKLTVQSSNKVSANSVLLANSISSSVTLLDPAPTITVGVSLQGDGTFTVYPANGAAPLTGLTEKEAWLQIGFQVVAQMPNFQGLAQEQQFMATWPTASRAVLQQLQDLEAQAAAAGTSDTFSATVEIDPMKFLKYGEEMRVRGVRVLETGNGSTG